MYINAIHNHIMIYKYVAHMLTSTYLYVLPDVILIYKCTNVKYRENLCMPIIEYSQLYIVAHFANLGK